MLCATLCVKLCVSLYITLCVSPHIKIHLTKKHQVECESCGKKIKSNLHLESHICDINTIENPDYHQLFIDGKLDSTDCLTIEKYNSKAKDSSLAFLLSKECWDGCENSCPELPQEVEKIFFFLPT